MSSPAGTIPVSLENYCLTAIIIEYSIAVL
jgi:hypothetical protein